MRIGDALGDVLRQADAALEPEEVARLQEALGSLSATMAEIGPLLERVAESVADLAERAEAAPQEGDASAPSEAGGEAGAAVQNASATALSALQEALGNLQGLFGDGTAEEEAEAGASPEAPNPAVFEAAGAAQEAAREVFEGVRDVQDELHEATQEAIRNLRGDAGGGEEYEVALADYSAELRAERRGQPLVVEAHTDPTPLVATEPATADDDADDGDEVEEAEPDDGEAEEDAVAAEPEDDGSWAAAEAVA